MDIEKAIRDKHSGDAEQLEFIFSNENHCDGKQDCKRIMFWFNTQQ